MNKFQAVAYAQMALHTIQNSALGDTKVSNLDLYNFGEEIRIMIELYPLKDIESKIKKFL